MRRRGSIAGPLSLIVFGVVALLIEMREVSAAAVWDWYLRWWPILLIAIGAISLAEWWLDRGSPLPRRRRSGWLVVLLILLVLIGHAQRGLRFWGGFENLGQNDPFFHFLDPQRRLAGSA